MTTLVERVLRRHPELRRETVEAANASVEGRKILEHLAVTDPPPVRAPDPFWAELDDVIATDTLLRSLAHDCPHAS